MLIETSSNTSFNQTEPIIEAFAITKRYRKVNVIDNVSLRLLPGQIVGLIGPNGAGKTTLLRLLSGLVIPNSGKVSYHGQEKGKAFESAKAKISVTVDAPSLYPMLSARDNVRAYALGKGLTTSDEDIGVALRSVGLKDDAKRVRSFSLGMKQRLSLALALSNGSEAILLDEPFNGIDPMGLRQIVELIRNINQEKGIAFLISSHNLPELEGLCKSFIFLEEGKIMKSLSKEELEKKEKRIVSFVIKDLEKCHKLLHETLLPFEERDGRFYVSYDGDPLAFVDLLKRNTIDIEDLSIEREGLLSVYSERRVYDE